VARITGFIPAVNPPPAATQPFRATGRLTWVIPTEAEMRIIGGLLIIVLLILAGGIATGFINLQRTQEGRLPELSVKGGTLPKYEANVAKVEVGSRNETVEVPTVDVKKP
jgi:hypothetical protein